MTKQLEHACIRVALIVLIGLLATISATPMRTGADPAPVPSGSQGVVADVMKKAPYLIYTGVPGQMKIVWQLSSTATSTVEWGTDPTYSAGRADNTEYGSDHMHAQTLGALSPATLYHYRVTTLGVSYTGTFRSAPDAGAGQLKFLAYGDTRSDPTTHDKLAAAMLKVIGTDPAYQTLTLCSGDLVAAGGDESYWTNEWFGASYANIRALTGRVAYAACMGNHETDGGSTLFPKYFPYAFAGSRYYSFDYGPAHFTVLDQYTSYDSSSTQGKWLKNDLSASRKVWKFVLLHEPGWSAAGGHSNNSTVQSQVAPFCERYGVAILFAGHNHYYTRAAKNGVRHVTTGGGGASLKTPDPSQPYVVKASSTHHFCQIAIDGNTLRFRAVNSSGAMIDSFSIQKSVADAVAPSVAVTSPAGGESWVQGSVHPVTWTASDNVGVASVSLVCSTDGGRSFPDTIARRIANTGTYSWTLPLITANSALIKVVAYDANGNVGSDVSDRAFAIVASSTGTLVSLVSADTGPGLVRVTWYTTQAQLAATVSRSAASDGWTPVATVTADGTGQLRYEDHAVEPGARYGYRLVIPSGTQEIIEGETWVTVPGPNLSLSLLGPTPNPARDGSIVVEFTLPEVGPTRLDLVDVSGRLVESRDVGASGPGSHVVALGSNLRPGVYWIRLTRGTQIRRLKATVTR